MEIIDHHRLGNIETMGPVFFRNQPVGCTATIVTQMYQEAGVKIPTKIAGLLCSAIISDTLLFRSPTCTAVDEKIAENLAKVAGINLEEGKSNVQCGKQHEGKECRRDLFPGFQTIYGK